MAGRGSEAVVTSRKDGVVLAMLGSVIVIVLEERDVVAVTVAGGGGTWASWLVNKALV